MKAKITLIICIFNFTISKAQWTTNTMQNTTVRDSVGADESTPLSVSTSDGKTYISYFAIVNGSYQMRMQLLDINGAKLWAPGGVIVSSMPQSTALFRYDLKVDLDNNAIVAFQDQRSGPLQVVVYKVDQAGNPSWGASGIQLIDPVASEGLAPVIGITNSNSVIVAWASSNSPKKWVTVNKIDGNGNLSWSSPMRVIDSVATKKYSRPSIVASGIDNFIMLYVEEVGNFPGVTSNMYAQKYDVNGATIWNTPVHVSTKTIAYFYFPEIISDNNNGFYIAFNTSNALSISQTDVYIQHVSISGVLWNASGNVVSTLSNTQHFTAGYNYDAVNSCFWVLLKVTDINQGMSGVFIQRIDTIGNALLTANGSQLVAVSATYNDPRGMAATTDGAIAVYSIGSNSTAETLAAVKCDTSGTLIWGGNSVVICSNSSGKDDLTAGLFKNNQVVFVWDDTRNDFGVYAQNISNSGQLGVVTAIEDINNANEIVVFPNPFSEDLQINFNKWNAADILNVYDSRGSVIVSQQINSNETILHTDQWPQGIYILNAGSFNKKIVKY